MEGFVAGNNATSPGHIVRVCVFLFVRLCVIVWVFTDTYVSVLVYTLACICAVLWSYFIVIASAGTEDELVYLPDHMHLLPLVQRSRKLGERSSYLFVVNAIQNIFVVILYSYC